MVRAPSKVRPIEHQSLVDRVTDELHRAILNGDIVPGSEVSIVELSEQFGVSHIPVREALRRLESEGVLSLRPGRSALVADLTIEELSNIYHLRRLIEGDLALRAGAALTEERLLAAEQALREYVDSERETAALATAHRAFHIEMLADVLGTADRQVLGQLWNSSDRYLHLLVKTKDLRPESLEARVADHETLLELARSGDADALREAWVDHLTSSEQELVAALS